jgi:hypothetical protein
VAAAALMVIFMAVPLNGYTCPAGMMMPVAFRLIVREGVCWPEMAAHGTRLFRQPGEHMVIVG